MEEEIKASGHHPADTNGDGKVSPGEHDMYMEFKRKELEDADAMRDAQRKMAWFSLFGLEEAMKTLGSMAPTYFVAVAGIVAAFFASQTLGKK